MKEMNASNTSGSNARNHSVLGMNIHNVLHTLMISAVHREGSDYFMLYINMRLENVMDVFFCKRKKGSASLIPINVALFFVKGQVSF